MVNFATGPRSEPWFQNHFQEIDAELSLDAGYTEQVYSELKTTGHDEISLAALGYEAGPRVLTVLIQRGLVEQVQSDLQGDEDQGFQETFWWKAN